MKVLTRAGIGDTGTSYPLTCLYPEAKVPVRALVDGVVTYTLFGASGPNEEWEVLREGESGDASYGIPHRPWLKLSVTSGSGRVSLWVAEA